MTQSFAAASFNMEENLMLVQYICFLSSHQVMIRNRRRGKKGGIPPKSYCIFFVVLFTFLSF